MTLAYTTVNWTPLNGAGQPLTGVTVTFAPTSDLTDITGGVFISSEPFTVTQNGSGVITTSLVATDNADISPQGWAWQVTTTVGRRASLSTVAVPSSPSTVDLDSLLPAPGGGTFTSGGGSGGAVASVNGQTGAVVLTAAEVGAASASALATETARAETAEAGIPSTGTPLAVNKGGTGSGTAGAALTALGAATAANLTAETSRATTAEAARVQLAGDLGGTTASPTVAKIQGTAIGSPPGGTTQFLRGDGTWQVPSGSGTGLWYGVMPSGALAETAPRILAQAASTSGLTSGTVQMAAIWLQTGTLVTNITFAATTQAEAGGTHGWYVLTDSSLVVKAVTADQTAATAWANNAALTLAAGTPFTTTYTGLHYLGWCQVAATTSKYVAIGTSSGFGLAIANLAPALGGTSSASQTTPPSTGTTLASITNTNTYIPYAYVS